MRINVLKRALMEVQNICNNRVGCEDCPFTKDHGETCFFDVHHNEELVTFPFEWSFEDWKEDSNAAY